MPSSIPWQAEEDFSKLGPSTEPEQRKRLRIQAMAQRLPDVLAALRATHEAELAQQEQQAGAASGAADESGGERDAQQLLQEPQEGAAQAGLREVVAEAVERTLPEAAAPGTVEHAGWHGETGTAPALS